ncbi:MAG: glycerophosphodiester phosphodiesterase family protein [Microbacteriaceae bacterium]
MPRIFAHRGLALEAPENTLLAFLKALTSGATHLETDVQVTSDGIAVLSHDPSLLRLTGRQIRIDRLRMSDLAHIDLGDGQSFTSLAAALDAFPDARFNIDVKAKAAPAAVVHAVNAVRAKHRVLITSFSEARRRATVDAIPGVASSASTARVIPILAAAAARMRAATKRAAAGLQAVQIPQRKGPVPLVTAGMVRSVHAAGLEVHVWTVNDPAEMSRLLALGVDGLVTDRCDLASAVIWPRL